MSGLHQCGSGAAYITVCWYSSEGPDDHGCYVHAAVSNSSSPGGHLRDKAAKVSGLSPGTYQMQLYDTKVGGGYIDSCSGSTSAGAVATFFNERIPFGQENTDEGNPPAASSSLSYTGRLSIADLLIKLSLRLKFQLSVTRRSRVIDQPVEQHIFDLLVPEIDRDRNSVGHYIRSGTSGGWKRVDTLVLPNQEQIPDTAVSHIQSFIAPGHLDALAWIQPSATLVAFEYRPETGVHQPITVSTDEGPVTQVNGKQALVQTDQGTFRLLVPVFSKGEQQIIDLVHTSETLQGPWKQVATLPPAGGSVVSIGLVQADGEGSLKAVARVRPSQGPDFLVSYQCNPNFLWQGPFPVSVRDLGETLAFQSGDNITNVAGSLGLDQSIFDGQQQLDLLVPLVNPSTGDITLIHFTQPAGPDTSIDQPWTFTARLRPLNDDPHTRVVSASVIQDRQHDLQCIDHVITTKGESLLVFYIFNPQTGWSPPSVVTTVDGNPIVVGGFVVPTLVSLTLDPVRVPSGGASQGTVTLSGPAPSGGELINLTSSNPNLVSVPANVTVVEGQSTAFFKISTVRTEVDGSANISASLAGVTQTATLTVLGMPRITQ